MKAASVRIGMKVASINPPDVLMPQDKYHVKVGDRVMTYAGLGCFADEGKTALHL